MALSEIAGAALRRELVARARAMRGFAPGSSSSTANSRAITRSILPSTGLARRSNAIAAIAAAV